MALVRMPLWGLSLCVMLLGPPSSLAGPEDSFPDFLDCQQHMTKIYEDVRFWYRVRLNSKEGPGNYDRTLVEKYLPPFKKKCGTVAANSMKELENGKYFHALAAEHEKEVKADKHVYDYGLDLDLLELQR
jgi:hypothetical protein